MKNGIFVSDEEAAAARIRADFRRQCAKGQPPAIKTEAEAMPDPDPLGVPKRSQSGRLMTLAERVNGAPPGILVAPIFYSEEELQELRDHRMGEREATLQDLLSKAQAEEAAFEAAIRKVDPLATRWSFYRSEVTSPEIVAAHGEYIAALHAFYLARDGERGFLGFR